MSGYMVTPITPTQEAAPPWHTRYSLPCPTTHLSPPGEGPTPTGPTSDLKSGPVPGCVVVGGPLQVPELDLIGGLRTSHTGRELHLQELVGLVPVYLRWGS